MILTLGYAPAHGGSIEESTRNQAVEHALTTILQPQAGLLAAGLLRFWTLTIHGTVAGAYYGFARASAAYAYLGGFDPEFAYESPGTLLVGAAIEAAWRDGAGQFHFLRGQEPYKYEWGARDLWTRRRLTVPQ